MKNKLWPAFIAAAVLAAPAAAQTTATTAQPAQTRASPSDDTTVVTIFGHRKGLISDQATFSIDRNSASSCGFIVGAGRFNSGSLRRRTFAPFGDASQEAPRFGLSGPNGAVTPGDSDDALRSSPCDLSDLGFAAGRADIARRDTSLKDAMAAYQAQDYAKAMTLFKTAWNKLGVVDAADLMGQMYLLGQGTPRNTAEAMVWLKTAAESPFTPGKDEQRFNPDTPDLMNGRTEAAMTLGKIYAVGLDVPADPKQARHWFSRADDFGYVPAAHLLGMLDESGYAGEGSLPDALKHFLKAAKAGYAPSQYEAGVIYYTGGAGVARDKAKAGAWLVEAAKHGDPDALYAVGRMYDLGEGGAKADPERALAYYKDAAVKGQPDAQNAIGLSFYQGQGLPKNDAWARAWFERAAEGGVPDAMFNLAVMEANGEGGKADPAAAYAWMRLAQKEGLDKAGPAAAELASKLTPEEKAKAEAALKDN